mmetsp:Transcript_72156/g.220938  ORF Transcript_72156/g.220938 Transcript_72156/m.220938 type:complete len:264 (+) Transcript_72156:425-1216(+)
MSWACTRCWSWRPAVIARHLDTMSSQASLATLSSSSACCLTSPQHASAKSARRRWHCNSSDRPRSVPVTSASWRSSLNCALSSQAMRSSNRWTATSCKRPEVPTASIRSSRRTWNCTVNLASKASSSLRVTRPRGELVVPSSSQWRNGLAELRPWRSTLLQSRDGGHAANRGAGTGARECDASGARPAKPRGDGSHLSLPGRNSLRADRSSAHDDAPTSGTLPPAYGPLDAELPSTPNGSAHGRADGDSGVAGAGGMARGGTR